MICKKKMYIILAILPKYDRYKRHSILFAHFFSKIAKKIKDTSYMYMLIIQLWKLQLPCTATI